MIISKSEIKGMIAIGVLCAVAFAFIYLVWPYTDMGKAVYDEKRQNAITYLNATAFTDDPQCIKQRHELIENYGLQDTFIESQSDPWHGLRNNE
jgi:hypothetical protein